MTGNKSYLLDYEEIDSGFVAFEGDLKGGKITGKGKISTGKLDFEDVYFIKEVMFNLFNVTQMCDKKNSVLFTDTECVVLSPDFKLLDENHVLLRVPRKDNMYNVDLKNIIPSGGLTCLFAKARLDESNIWLIRLGHINFKTMNKLVRGNLVRGLPSKIFENNHTCVACQKGKQHKTSCKTKTVSSISQPLQLLHMDLFGPTFVKSLMKKMYCLVVTDDYSRFSWVFFLATKDETSEILKTFITGIENLIDLKVKVIRCDNGTEFKNKVMNQFCEMKGIKREFSVARTPQQNGVAERKNRTLIEAARTMLADSKLPTTFWAEAVNTVCYVQNRVLVIKPQNKTPYELFLGRKPALSFMRPFRVFNSRIRIVEENLHVKFSKATPNIAGSGPNWLFDIDALTKSMNYEPVVAGNQSNGNADPSFSSNSKDSPDAGFKALGEEEKIDTKNPENENSAVPNTEEPRVNQEQDESINITNNINIASLTVNNASIEDNALDENIVNGCIDDPNMPNLEEIVYSDDDEEVGAEADMNNLAITMPVGPILTTRVWTLIDLPHGKRAIGTKWVYRNKKDERGIVIMNKARLVTQGYTQEVGINYDEMDVKSAFLYGKIEEEVYVCQPPGFEDPQFPNKVYKVEKRVQIDKTLFIKRVKGDILLVQVYVDDSIFRSTKKGLCTEFKKLMQKKFQMSSMASRPDIMFVVCACARFQVTPKVSHLHAVKRIFRYLKGQPKLGLWYPKDSPFDLEAYTDSDYAGVSLDRKSTIGAASSCRRQVLWIQNQMLDYGYNFMNTKIFIDNESTICIVKNPVFHSKTKHIEIRHHFIRDSYEKRLIQVIKIHTDHNVADLLTKAFDVSRFQYLIETAKNEIQVSAVRVTYYRPILLVSDETVIKEWEDRMERATTITSSLEAEQDSGNINRTQSMATLNESLSQETSLGSGPMCQDNILGGAEAQIRFEAASKQSNDPPFSRVNTLGSEEDNMKLKELIEFCTKLFVRALDL
ncbi:putative ribonuclease H-like domain-containing protein [Tanacetum coccineum]